MDMLKEKENTGEPLRVKNSLVKKLVSKKFESASWCYLPNVYLKRFKHQINKHTMEAT